MGLLGKKGADIDYTLLQKKGLIKKEPEEKAPYKVNSQGVIDFTDNSSAARIIEKEAEIIESSPQTSDAQNPFSFLDNVSQNQSSVSPIVVEENNDLNAMKNKVEDLEFKLERLIEKLSAIESKLENFERKVLS